MNIGSAQSQSSILSAASIRTVLPTSASGQSRPSVAARARKPTGTEQRDRSRLRRSVLRDAVEKRLQTALTDAGIDVSAEEVLSQAGDISPEATAERLVEFATGFLTEHKLAHADLE